MLIFVKIGFEQTVVSFFSRLELLSRECHGLFSKPSITVTHLSFCCHGELRFTTLLARKEIFFLNASYTTTPARVI